MELWENELGFLLVLYYDELCKFLYYNVIIEIKYVVNVMYFKHFETIPPNLSL